jgi:voltage-dependent potassium channel beta subunit
MNYRRLGSAGLKVSELSYGAWVSFKTQLGGDTAYDCMKAAYESGVNFFDNAESYAAGEAEVLMGEALRRAGWRRASYVVSTKFFWGLNEGPNERNTLNRKYLMQAIDGSLKRLGLDYVDLIFCHRPDPDTPVEETVRAMHDIVASGKALYWGTSEWSAAEIMAAWQIAERHHLHKPQMEQPQYNMLWRNRVEKEYARLYQDIGLGLTIWSPLASGLLTGKYAAGIPSDSRAALPGYEWLRSALTDEGRNAIVKGLEPVAADLGCSLAQLAIAWCVKNPNVSTVITGASRVEQVHENMKSLDVVAKLTPDVVERIEGILNNKPE